ncbi:hypothetical protein BT93_F2829 [Corymbia citriodora subsp. variegata]|nr:hypothetical protein BT93_F2829 [Corymbia citriodora subsp. variegata]
MLGKAAFLLGEVSWGVGPAETERSPVVDHGSLLRGVVGAQPLPQPPIPYLGHPPPPRPPPHAPILPRSRSLRSALRRRGRNWLEFRPRRLDPDLVHIALDLTAGVRLGPLLDLLVAIGVGGVAIGDGDPHDPDAALLVGDRRRIGAVVGGDRRVRLDLAQRGGLLALGKRGVSRGGGGRREGRHGCLRGRGRGGGGGGGCGGRLR